MTARILECINKLGADNSISSYLFDALGAKKSKKVLSKEEQVFVQAIRHNLRLDNLDILRENRPSEPEYILKYRNDNLRQITIENSEKFIAELVNTFNNSGFTLQDASDKLKDYLNGKNFYYNYQKIDFINWVNSCLIPYAQIDPNSCIIHVPHDVNNKLVFEHLIIPFNKYKVEEDFAIFKVGKRKYELGATIVEKDEYYICTKDKWSKTSYTKDFEGKITQTIVDFYSHHYEDLPISYMYGVVSIDPKTNKKFKETRSHAAYIWADEALVQLSENQAINVKAGFPILKIVGATIKCVKCNGEEQIKNDKGEFIECPACDGKGKIMTPGPLEVLNLTKTIEDNSDKGTTDASWLSPDVSIIKNGFERFVYFYEQSKRANGIDVLLNLNESGAAMDTRLEFLKSRLSIEIMDLIDCLETSLTIIESELNFNTKKTIPKYSIPSEIKIQNRSVFIQNINNAVGIERKIAVQDYYNFIFRNNDKLKKVFQIIVKYFYNATYSSKDLISLAALEDINTLNNTSRDLQALDILLEKSEEEDFFKLKDIEIYNYVISKINS